jgi:hypothetical protein
MVEPRRGGLGLDLVALAALCPITRLTSLDHNPHEDELTQLLAARSLLADGTLAIDGGQPYTRAWVYTYLVAGAFRVGGEGLPVGRLPAVLFGTLLVLALFVWLRGPAGRAGAWAAIPSAERSGAGSGKASAGSGGA